MKPVIIHPSKGLAGSVTPPGDKSISHRAVILAALARGTTTVKNFLFSDDCLVTLNVLRDLGVKIKIAQGSKTVVVASEGRFRPSRTPLWMGESGTSCRVLLGLLAGQKFSSRIVAAPSLMKRPMARVIAPLRKMGSLIFAHNRGGDEYLPLEIAPSRLHSIRWEQKIASAQVKSAILLAGLYAEGETEVREAFVSRDHTERMLKFFKARIDIKKGSVRISKGELTTPGLILVPSDISSAAFFVVAALLIKGSKLKIRNVCLNPTRCGALDVLKKMGGRIVVSKTMSNPEPIADLEVFSSDLRGAVIRKTQIPSLIDELPILMVAASLARGKTVIHGAGELRVKETDRIHSIVSNLTKLGANIRVRSLKNDVTIEIEGVRALHGAPLKSYADHRTAMSMYVAGLAAEGTSSLDDMSCVAKSFPEFLTVMNHLLVR